MVKSKFSKYYFSFVLADRKLSICDFDSKEEEGALVPLTTDVGKLLIFENKLFSLII